MLLYEAYKESEHIVVRRILRQLERHYSKLSNEKEKILKTEKKHALSGENADKLPRPPQSAMPIKPPPPPPLAAQRKLSVPFSDVLQKNSEFDEPLAEDAKQIAENNHSHLFHQPVTRPPTAISKPLTPPLPDLFESHPPISNQVHAAVHEIPLSAPPAIEEFRPKSKVLRNSMQPAPDSAIDESMFRKTESSLFSRSNILWLMVFIISVVLAYLAWRAQGVGFSY